MKAISALNPPKSSGEMPKVRWIQTKCSKDFRFCKERTSRWMPLCLIALENNVNLPDLAAREDGWEVESLILLCEVLLVWTQAPQAQNTWCMRQLVYIENCMGKSPIVKKCVNYPIWNKVLLPQMCRELVSCADFKAILTPFSGVIWNRYSF